MSRQYRVLLVDDEPIILRSLKVALPWAEMNMVIVGDASNGEEGLKQIQSLQPDIVISDIRMPVMDGISMMRESIQRNSTLIYVLLSGYGEFEYARDAIRSGAFDYLLKPVDHEELEKVMREAKARLDLEAEQQSEREYLQRSVQALSSLVRERLISSMLEGNDKPYDPTYWLKGWDMEHPYLMLLVAFDDTLEVNRWSREDRKLWFFAVSNILSEYGDKCGAFTVFPFQSGEWVMVIQNMEYTSAEQKAEEIIVLVKACTKLSCSVGISHMHTGLNELFACYRSAQRALVSRFSGGREHVYRDGGHQSLVPNEEKEGAEPSGLPKTIAEQFISFESRLTGAIMTFDKMAVASLLEELIRTLRESCLTREDTTALLIELTVGISRRLSDLCGEPIVQMKELISNLPLCGTLEEMNRLLGSSLLEYISRIINASAREEDAHSIRKAIDYMASRFHHDLSIDEVSEFIGLSCSHFCVLFKKETGVTFLEYLTRLRIERATSILRNTDVKVYQIAPLVGYQDAKYFTQVFKRLMDMTPTEYRTMLHSETGSSA